MLRTGLSWPASHGVFGAGLGPGHKGHAPCTMLILTAPVVTNSLLCILGYDSVPKASRKQHWRVANSPMVGLSFIAFTLYSTLQPKV